MHKQLNRRIGVEFFNTLIQHQTFRDNYKAISGAEYFLLKVAKFNEEDGGGSEIYSRKIYDVFKNYDKEGDYRKYIDALITLGLLVNTNPSYRVSTNDGAGWCKKYQITEKGLDLINNNLKEYLKKLYDDRKFRRANQQSISSRRVMHESYNDYVLNYIWDGIKNISLDRGTVNEVLGTITKERAKAVCLSILVKFKTKKFGELTYNESDGRVWNEYVALKGEFRTGSKYKGMKRLYTLDIRACHPTFFALYLRQLYYKDYNSKNTNYNNINYLINKEEYQVSPYCSPEQLQYIYPELETEVNKYNQMFTNSIDPRISISEAIGYNLNNCKTYLNATINGSETHKPLLRYLEYNFPLLFQIWRNSDVKTTGNNISKMFETKLMLNPELYELAESLNVKLIYEYDGLSLFFDEQDSQAHEKAQFIQHFIIGESKKLWGLEIVIKLEDEYGNLVSTDDPMLILPPQAEPLLQAA